jgi:ATP-binding cassette subfamily F protein uup
MYRRLRPRGAPPVENPHKPPSVKAEPAARAEPAEAPKPKSKLSYKDQRELDGMEAAIEAAEAAKSALEKQLADPAVYAQASEFKRISNEFDAAGAEVEKLYARWQHLQSLLK